MSDSINDHVEVSPQDPRAALQEMRESVKPTVEVVRGQLTQILQERLQKDWEAYEKREEGFSFDHYILALGDPLVGKNKHLLDKRFTYVCDVGTPFFFSDNYHVGSVSYALLRAQVDRTKRVSVPGNRTMTIGELIFYPLEHIEKEESIKDHETEWLVLLAVASLKSGRKTQIKFHNGSDIKLEDLVQMCRDEFQHIVDPSQLDDEAKEQILGSYRGVGTCDGLHALHALFAYAVFQNNGPQINAYCDTIFSIIEYLKKPKEQRADVEEGPKNTVAYIAHLLTPLTELSADYPLDAHQKALIKWAVDELIRQIESFSYASLSVSDMSHALDVLKHIPDEWVK